MTGQQQQPAGDVPMAADNDPAIQPLAAGVTARVGPAAANAAAAAKAPPPPLASAAFSTASSTAGAPNAADAVAAMLLEDNAVTSPPPPAPAGPAAPVAAPPPLFFAPTAAGPAAAAAGGGSAAQIAIGGHRGMGMNVLLDAAAHAAASTSNAAFPPAFEFAATSAAAGSAPSAVAASATRGLAPTPAAAAAAALQSLPPTTTTAGSFFISPAWRENTVSSMRAAAQAGASFVEFDVQVTSDGHAVLWHDDCVEYGDPLDPERALVGDLTLAEFRALGHLTASGAGERLSVVRAFWTHGTAGTTTTGSDSDASGALGASPPPVAAAAPLARAATLGAANAAIGNAAPPPPALSLPANSGDSSGSAATAPPRYKSPHRRWRCRHEEPFPALEEVFAALPSSVAFNIEVKMATPSSLERTPQEEIERVVAPVLATVERCLEQERQRGGHGGHPPHHGHHHHNSASSPRTVVFSSFDPDVCAALKARTATHPVCLLSTGATEPHADPRRTCLRAAVTFAAQARLAGIVVDSTALSLAPETVAQARQEGLAVMTYGGANGDSRWVARQAALGVHAAIVDDVEGVLRGLREPAAPEEDQEDAVMAAA